MNVMTTYGSVSPIGEILALWIDTTRRGRLQSVSISSAVSGSRELYATAAVLAAGGGIATLSSTALALPLPFASAVASLPVSSALGFFFFFNRPRRQLRGTMQT